MYFKHFFISNSVIYLFLDYFWFALVTTYITLCNENLNQFCTLMCLWHLMQFFCYLYLKKKVWSCYQVIAYRKLHGVECSDWSQSNWKCHVMKIFFTLTCTRLLKIYIKDRKRHHKVLLRLASCGYRWFSSVSIASYF